jgi:tetratricopeptide (TPR) repeat protein
MSARHAAVAAVWVAWATAAYAQIPDTFTNLKVLPKDIPKPELIRVMREFSTALGVRCIHCHAGTDAVDLAKVDFASDDKENKLIARSMMGMTKGINASLQTDIGAVRPAHLEVTCFTCHHGNQRPETLAHALVAELDRNGIDSTLVKYRRLREEFYGRAAYDFSEWSLISVAEDLARNPDRAGAALVLLNENLLYYPESAGTYARAAETYLAMGDTTAAMTQFGKALALAPEDPWLQRRIDRVKAKK